VVVPILVILLLSFVTAAHLVTAAGAAVTVT
jgi:hypothetical protein